MRGPRSGRADTNPIRVAGQRTIAALFTLLVLTLTGLLVPAAAHAQSSQFWGFYQWTEEGWQMSMEGADQVVPSDGDVDGWRFAISIEGEERVPRADGDFDQICGGTPERSGMKRVAVVIDYGLAEEAPGGNEVADPHGACAVVEPDASSGQVLAGVATVRIDGGRYCAVNQYPTSGCGEPVDETPEVEFPEPQVGLGLPAGSNRDGGLPIWGIAAVALVLLLIFGGLLTRRFQTSRRSDSAGDDDSSGSVATS